MNPEALTLNGQDLLEPVEAVPVPRPGRRQTAQEFVAPILAANTAESQERDRVFNEIQDLQSQDRPSFDAQFNRQLGRLGTPEAVQRLRDTQTELARLNTQFDVQNVQIDEAAGQSIGQAQREITQNDRERAVRTAGLAAQAQVLQGNIQTAQSIARDAVNFAFEDRRLELQALGAQYDALQDRVSGQEAQLLDQRRRELDEAQRQLERVESNVELAIATGAADPREIDALTSDRTSDEEKLSLSQSILGRMASEDRAKEQELRQAQINSANRANRIKPTSRSTSIVEIGDEKMLIDTQTGEVIQSYGTTDQSVGELQEARLVDEVAVTDDLLDHPGLNGSVGPTGIARIGVIDAFSGAGDDFRGSVDSLTKGLTIDTLVEAKANGATFGALNEQEFTTLADAATKINGWRNTDSDGETESFDASESDFKDELDKINGFRKLDAVLKGVAPEAVGVTITPDGAYWTEGWDGQMIQIR